MQAEMQVATMAVTPTLKKDLLGAFKPNDVPVTYAHARPDLIEQSGAFVAGMTEKLFTFPRENEHAAGDRAIIYADRHRIVTVKIARTQRLAGINTADDLHQQHIASEAMTRAEKAKDPRSKPTFRVLAGASLAHGLSLRGSVCHARP